MHPSDRPLDRPHAERLRPTDPHYAVVLEAHRAALAAQESGYADPVTGLFVFTAAALVEQGDCCERGCRHCPYG